MGNATCCNRLDIMSLLAEQKNFVEINNLIIENEPQSENIFEKSKEKIIILQNNWRCFKARFQLSKAKSEKYFNFAKIPGLELSQNQMINRCTPLMEEVEKKLGPFDQSKKKAFNPLPKSMPSNKNVNSNLNNNNNNIGNSFRKSNSNMLQKDSYMSLQNVNEFNANITNSNNNQNFNNSVHNNYFSNNNNSANNSVNFNNNNNINNSILNGNNNNIRSNNNNFYINNSSVEKEKPEKDCNIPLRTTSILYPDNTIYTGSYNFKWEKHGFGTLYTKDNAKITGFFREDRLCGRGRIIYPEGDYFEGEFVEDKLSGLGEYVNVQGIKYRGEWKDDMKNGYGEESHPDGTLFAGEFFNDIKHGKGCFRWADGSVYDGSLFQNQIDGVGKMAFYDGQFFKGEWRSNKIEGRGFFLWPDKKVYIGSYKNEKKWGYGVFIWPNGRRYEGQWLNGKQHGFGICYWNQKKQLSEWRLGKKQKMQNDSIEEMKNKIMQINFNIAEVIAFSRTIGLEIDENYGYIKIDETQILYELSAPPTNIDGFFKENREARLQQE